MTQLVKYANGQLKSKQLYRNLRFHFTDFLMPINLPDRLQKGMHLIIDDSLTYGGTTKSIARYIGRERGLRTFTGGSRQTAIGPASAAGRSVAAGRATHCRRHKCFQACRPGGRQRRDRHGPENKPACRQTLHNFRGRCTAKVARKVRPVLAAAMVEVVVVRYTRNVWRRGRCLPWLPRGQRNSLHRG